MSDCLAALVAAERERQTALQIGRAVRRQQRVYLEKVARTPIAGRAALVAEGQLWDDASRTATTRWLLARAAWLAAQQAEAAERQGALSISTSGESDGR